MTRVAKNRIYIAPFRSRITGQFPYDMGDDPSFQSMRQEKGQLTWGVCRADVRNSIRVGDIVVFFSFSAPEQVEPIEYRLCAVATVERKVSQAEIWRDRALKKYRKYANLLIRPGRNGSWEHFEPGFEDIHEHKDWGWRIAERKGRRRVDFEQLNSLSRITPSARVGRRPFRFARNYVIFSSKPAETLILSNPPVVAWSIENGRLEKWEKNALSHEIQKYTLGIANQFNNARRSLRTTNKQRAHRHIRWRMQPQEALRWRREFIGFLRRHARGRVRGTSRRGKKASGARSRWRGC